ncbi:MAG: biotin/lipoyl-containing protein [Anaerolineales bacterium]
MTPSAKKQLKLSIGGKPFVVELGDLEASPISVTVNGQEYQAEIEAAERETPAITEAAPVAPSVSGPVASPVKPKRPVTPTAGAGDEVRSPMPGDILDIKVKAGDQVSVGDHLCSLEAMKMKSAIRSARDGVIATVEVSEGQAVAHGDVLITFE